MDKGPPPALFVNDGSFMEKFKQLQQEQEKEKNNKLSEPKPIKVVSGSLAPKTSISRVNDTRKTSQAGSSGKLAFSLKQKSKLVPPPVKLADDEEEETDAGDFSNAVQAKRQKVDQEDGTAQPSRQLDVAYASTTYQESCIGKPATRVIFIPLFMLLVLISFISDMQHPQPQVIQW